MPELPEVETVKNVLKKIVIGRKIISIDVLRDCTIVGDQEEFTTTLKGKTFLDITRIGKFLVFHLSDDVVFISHLRMEGKYFEVKENEPNTKYARLVFHLDNNHKICYDDSRCFGMMKLAKEDNYKELPDIAKLGPEPFAIDDIDYLYNKNKKNKGPIKSTLLDQSLMTGLGNIYADEVLFKSKIHPLTPAYLLNKKEWQIIKDNAVIILNEAIKAGGSTIKSYHPGKDIDGNFQTSLQAYGKADEPCPRCGHKMRFIKVGGRGTTFCPVCQIKKGAPIHVGIYGKIASGKSSILNKFKELGADTISSDEIVSKLYEGSSLVEPFNELFKLEFKNNIDKNILREYLSNHPEDIKKVNRLVHPLVRTEIEKFFKNSKKDIVVAEIPLLYEAKMEDLFDYIIAVDINNETQLKRLKERNKLTQVSLEKINKYHQFELNKEKADIIIDNSSSINNLNKQINNIFNKLKCRLDQ